MKSPLLLLPLQNVMPLEVLPYAASQGRILACDFAVSGVEAWEEKPWGYELDSVVNIDHHAQTPVMRRFVSSANLALEYVRANGLATAMDTIVINHTDCDSVLAAAILRGDIATDDKFGAAAVAADHTGEDNAIADLLQALDSRRDYSYSLWQLQVVLTGHALDGDAQTALEQCFEERVKAAQLVQNGAFTIQDGIAWVQFDDRISGEFFPALLPDAKLIITFSPSSLQPGTWINKVRLGQNAPESFSLLELMKNIDPNFGGRWNAGSNKRGGGSPLSPQEYMKQLFSPR